MRSCCVNADVFILNGQIECLLRDQCREQRSIMWGWNCFVSVEQGAVFEVLHHKSLNYYHFILAEAGHVIAYSEVIVPAVQKRGHFQTTVPIQIVIYAVSLQALEVCNRNFQTPCTK